jgi:hypothetical protein
VTRPRHPGNSRRDFPCGLWISSAQNGSSIACTSIYGPATVRVRHALATPKRCSSTAGCVKAVASKVDDHLDGRACRRGRRTCRDSYRLKITSVEVADAAIPASCSASRQTHQSRLPQPVSRAPTRRMTPPADHAPAIRTGIRRSTHGRPPRTASQYSPTRRNKFASDRSGVAVGVAAVSHSDGATRPARRSSRPVRSSRGRSSSDRMSTVSRSRSISPGFTVFGPFNGLLPRPRVFASRVEAVRRHRDRLLAHGSRVRSSHRPHQRTLQDLDDHP